MTVKLSNLRPPRGSRHKKVRVGRGMGSKLGKTAGKGNKGQQSRAGYSRRWAMSSWLKTPNAFQKTRRRCFQKFLRK